MRRLRAGKSARRWLIGHAGVEEEEEQGPRAQVTATLRALGR
jgi:hypothetical protein